MLQNAEKIIKRRYDKNGNLIHVVTEDGEKKYDANGNLIFVSSLNGEKAFYEYDENNRLVHYKKSTLFWISEGWQEFDEHGNLIHFKDAYGNEIFYEYDKNNNLIHKKSLVDEEYRTYNEKGDLLDIITL